MRCPKRGFEQDEGPECLRCGVIFSRFRQPTEVPTERQLPLPPVSPAKPAPAPRAAGDPASPAPPVPPIPSEAGSGGAPPDPVPPLSLASARAEIFRVFFTFGPRLLLVAMLLGLLFAPLLYPLGRWAGLDRIPVTELPHNQVMSSVPLPERSSPAFTAQILEHEKRAIRALGRCLDAYRQQRRSGYPRDLAAVGAVGDRLRGAGVRREPGPPADHHL